MPWPASGAVRPAGRGGGPDLTLRPGGASSVPGGRGYVGARPEGGHKNDPRDGTALCEDGLRAGAVWGEETGLGRAESGLSVSKGAVRKKGQTFYYGLLW